MEKIPYNKNPFLLGHENLFDLTDEGEEVNAFSIDDAANNFITSWMTLYDPYVNYPDVFPEEINGNKDAELQLHHVKNFYKSYVYEGNWSDEKYVLVLEEIFKSHRKVNSYILDNVGNLYDKGQLQFQLVEKRRRRKRI